MAHKITIWALLIFPLLVPPAGALNTDSLFTAGNQLYDSAQYRQALQTYLELERNGFQSAALFFNIGNSYFKEGELGYAILYYLRAQRLDPGDDEIKTNLEFARQFMPTIMEGVKINPVSAFFDSITAPFTLNGLAWISSLFFVILMLTISARLYFQNSSLLTRIVTILLLILLLVSSGLTTYKYRTDYLARKGVIIASEAKVLSGPDDDNDVEFTGGAGLTFVVQKELNDFYQVIFENKRKGWIRKAEVAII